MSTTLGSRYAGLVPQNPEPLYRADTDQAGRWCVWHRLGQHGWTITQCCENRSAAEAFAADLNRTATFRRF